MKTEFGPTLIVVEFFAAGALMLSAVLFLAASFTPGLGGWVQALYEGPGRGPDSFAHAALFVSAAYAVGIVSEFIGWWAFEWRLHGLKRHRMFKFIQENRPRLHRSPFLYRHANVARADRKKLDYLHGVMRFHILQHSEVLYREIESQLARLRLIRPLFLIEVLVLVGLIVRIRSSAGAPWMAPALVGTVALLVANGIAIEQRFRRYLRAIERGYRTLFLDQLR